MIRELLCLESGTIVLRYPGLRDKIRELLCLTRTLVLQQGSGLKCLLHSSNSTSDNQLSTFFITPFVFTARLFDI